MFQLYGENVQRLISQTLIADFMWLLVLETKSFIFFALYKTITSEI